MALVDEVFKAGNIAVITGSSSGIGRAVARRCAQLKMKVVLADVDEEELEEARAEVAELADKPEDVFSQTTNVASAESLRVLQDTTWKKFGGCHFLMNNAGVGSGGGVLAPLSIWRSTIDVNLWGPIHGCLAFLEPMQKFLGPGVEGLIVNTGSKQGITMPPGNLVYNTSKAALKCFTEGLEHELRNVGADGTQGEGAQPRLRAALLVPGWVNSSIALKAKRASLAGEL